MENFFLEKENTYNSHQAYKNSKLANAMFTYELAKQLENTGVTVNCLCPGMPTVFHTLLISSIHNPMIFFFLSPHYSPHYTDMTHFCLSVAHTCTSPHNQVFSLLIIPFGFSGFIPTTELFRNTSNAQKFYRKFILHGLLRFTKATRSVEQGAKAVVEMATGEKLKGKDCCLQ